MAARGMNPFQREFLACIAAWQDREGQHLSGRAFGALVGRSSNHFHQMANEGFVPAGESIREMARILGLSAEAEERLVRAAIATKAAQRTRDSFWLNEAERMLSRDSGEAESLRAFIEEQGLSARYSAWKRRRR